MTEQELREMSIEDRNRILDAWKAEKDQDIKDAQDEAYAELAHEYKVLVSA